MRLNLYAISDGNSAKIEAAILGGITMLQLRAKHLPDDELLALAKKIKVITDKHGIPLIINDHLKIAQEIDAAGVHLGPLDGDLRAARNVLGPGKILGATARTLEQALAAEQTGADYLGSGAVFGSTTKLDASAMPHDTFREICASVRIPVVAIGGIDCTNIAQLKGCGMAGFAVVNGLFGSKNVGQAARELREKAEELL
jgi:thiamine-phosphate pyrophosphorylase